MKRKAQSVFGLATGQGLDDDVLGAYRFLCEAYQEGDKVWLFGFSRGAYTVRVLAAFVHVIGLLRPEQLNLAAYAFSAYKKSSADSQRKDNAPHSWLAISFKIELDFVEAAHIPNRDLPEVKGLDVPAALC